MKFYHGSLTARLLGFFEANPEEELTYRDIASKFDANPRTVETTVKRLRNAGLLESVHVIRKPSKGRTSA